MRRSVLSLRLCCVSATLVGGCFVYEVPSDAVDPVGEAGENNGGTSGGSGPSASGSASGGTASGGQPMGGTATAGTMTSGTAGTTPSDPPAGGEGGAPPEVDECPDNPDKLAPGACGCDFPDSNTATRADCRDIKAALVHRYDFEGTGTAVMDRAGSAHGTIVGGPMLSKVNGKGVVELSGGATGPYVDLPNGIVSQLTDASFEAWVTWRGGNNWQRIFDFGDTTHVTPEDNPANGRTYLYLTPRSGEGFAGSGYSLEGNSMGQELRVMNSAPLAQSLNQVVVVANAAADKLTVYINGSKAAEQTWTGALGSINDVNVWLGRSQYSGDHELNGIFHDFRIYDAALDALQIATCFAAGPDPAFLID
jgi:hypothetical protein